MCCSPQRAGFQVRFDGFNIEPSAVDEFDD
jgi:regulation of enolase protein 1 (concanavalin A-like superfamily)